MRIALLAIALMHFPLAGCAQRRQHVVSECAHADPGCCGEGSPAYYVVRKFEDGQYRLLRVLRFVRLAQSFMDVDERGRAVYLFHTMTQDRKAYDEAVIGCVSGGRYHSVEDAIDAASDAHATVCSTLSIWYLHHGLPEQFEAPWFVGCPAIHSVVKCNTPAEVEHALLPDCETPRRLDESLRRFSRYGTGPVADGDFLLRVLRDGSVQVMAVEQVSALRDLRAIDDLRHGLNYPDLSELIAQGRVFTERFSSIRDAVDAVDSDALADVEVEEGVWSVPVQPSAGFLVYKRR